MTEDEFFNKYGWWCVAVVVILFTIAVGFAACDMITEAKRATITATSGLRIFTKTASSAAEFLRTAAKQNTNG